MHNLNWNRFVAFVNSLPEICFVCWMAPRNLVACDARAFLMRLIFSLCFEKQFYKRLDYIFVVFVFFFFIIGIVSWHYLRFCFFCTPLFHFVPHRNCVLCLRVFVLPCSCLFFYFLCGHRNCVLDFLLSCMFLLLAFFCSSELRNLFFRFLLCCFYYLRFFVNCVFVFGRLSYFFY